MLALAPAASANQIPVKILMITVLLSWWGTVLGSGVTTGVDPQTGLKYWEWKDDTALLRLTQRLPDQTRAFFLSRGFSRDNAELFATSCVFQSMFRHIGTPASGTISIDLTRWQVDHDGSSGRLRVREDWEAIWSKSSLPRSAVIAFEWSLLPTTQEYASDDYNWGMTSYGLSPGVVFDLDFSWQREGEIHPGRITGIECAPDIHPEPGGDNR